MRQTRLLFALLMAAAFLLVAGYTERVAAVEVVVKQAPPAAPQVDVIGVQPSPRHVWVPGYWEWRGERGQRWVWVNGKWALPPYPGGAWIPGHWARHPDGFWHWVPGHWAYY